MKRRNFMKSVLAGTAAAGIGAGSVLTARGNTRNPFMRREPVRGNESRVALVRGTDRKDNMMKALEMIESDIRAGIGTKQVVIKPNFTRVKKDEWLASTHVDGVSAVCEIISSFYDGKIIIAEGTGPGSSLDEALDSFEYRKLQDRYNVEFFDLRTDEYTMLYILNKEVHPVGIRSSKLLLNPDVYLVSAACMKTHSLAALTLGLKNIVMAVPMKFNQNENDRALMHSYRVSSDPKYFNFNLFQLAQYSVPDLVTIDGFIGMEGDGPLSGDPVESGIALAGTDWLAADRVGTEVMGFDFNRVGHLRYCAEAQMGEANLSKINVLGNSIAECTTPYAMPPAGEKLLM